MRRFGRPGMPRAIRGGIDVCVAKTCAAVHAFVAIGTIASALLRSAAIAQDEATATG